MTERRWNGARWWKFDFHTHTPASNDYGKGPQQKELRKRKPKEWLLDYMRAEIDCVAVTDHNTGKWVDLVKEALRELELEKPEGFRPLHVFPGVELSVNGGVHLLAIFDPSKTSADIEALRGAVGYQGTPGWSDGVTGKSFVDVANEVVAAGGVAIPAHVDKDNGLFLRLQGITLRQALGCKNIFAMELIAPDSRKPQLYINNKNKLNWTEIIGSDSHHPSGEDGQNYPGSRFTWVKMGYPNIEGLRLALRDGYLSVRRSDRGDGNPNEHADMVIESISVSKARYIGRTRSFEQTFNPWLNAIIGGRGTGKSTLVEFLRLVLRRQEEIPNDLQAEFGKYRCLDTDTEDGGLLTDQAIIRAVYRKNDSLFRIQWSPSGDLKPIEQEFDGTWQPAEGDIRQRFPVRIYSQKQVFQLAKTPLALLKVIDEAPDVKRHSWSEKWKEEESRFLSLRAQIREINAGLADEPHFRGYLEDLKRKLAVFEQAGHANVLKMFQRRSRQYRDVEAWEKSWAGAGNQLRKAAAAIVPDILDGTSFDFDSTADKELKDYAAEARNSLDEICKKLEALAAQADEAAAEWRKNRDGSSWERNVDAALQAYENLQDNLARERVGDPAAYGQLVQSRQNIEQRLKELYGRRKQVDELKKKSKEQLQKLTGIRRELTEGRRKFLDRVLKANRYVRIRVVPYGARETVESEFRRLIQIGEGGFEKDIGSPDGEGLLGKLYASGDGAKNIERNLVGIKDSIKQIASNRHDPATVGDKRFAARIGKLPPEALDRLDLWFPEDSLEVRYSAAGDGRHLQPIREGSPGQKTAALLAFLLSYGEEPLILDQPEDDLDNRLIYDLIVTQLREVKRRRQVIVVTHNANIVVNGDAELVAALGARGRETQQECAGSLQEKQVRDTICAIMEGGRKAFDERYRRIALEEHHV